MIRIISEKEDIDIEAIKNALEEKITSINEDKNKSENEKTKEITKLYRKLAKETRTVLNINLDLKLSANANAEVYYQKRKAASLKLEKTLKAFKLAEEQAKLKGLRVAKKVIYYFLLSFPLLFILSFLSFYCIIK